MKKTHLCRAMSIAFGAAVTSLPALAQQTLERVEITGSAIKRIDAETAVPVTILKVDDLRKEGVSTVEQILTRISAAQVQVGTSQAVGSTTGGGAFADLRGIGRNKTLILLNGRRIANQAVGGAGDSSAPDINAIPFAAIERVEVLRDGASALYGTDAISGVINFITRRDFTGTVMTVGTDKPDRNHAGKAYVGNATFGTGDLAKDRFNMFGVVDYQKQDRIRASDQPFSARSQKTSPSTFPGQYNQGGNVENPLFPGCGTPNGIPLSAGGGDKTCGYLYARQVDDVANAERASVLLHGTGLIAPETRANLEYFVTRSRVDTLTAGVPYGALTINPGTRYYPGNGITPLPTAFTLDPTYFPANHPAGTLPGFVRLRWRDQVSGGRAEQTVNTQQRFVASIDGSLAGWDYQGGLSYNRTSLQDRLTGGYTDGTLVTPAIRNGVVNPFSLTQDAAGASAIAAAAAKGTLFSARGEVAQADAKASRELGDWLHAGRPAALAVGAEFRHEKYRDVGNAVFDALVVNSTGFDPATDNEGQRNVAAGFAEINVPLFSQLEVTASVRYDHYNDFGNTTNPKASFRYEPFKQLLLRGSYSTGFRAPSLFDLHAPQTYTNTANNHNDPVRCPVNPATGVAGPIAGVSRSDNCAVQFESLTGGNVALQPEKSRNFTAGIVFEPIPDANIGLDFFWIKLRQQIGTLSDDTIFANPAKYASAFKRAPDGSLATDGSLCPGPNCGYILATTQNLGEVHTSGVDISLNYRLRAGSIGNFNFGSNSTYVRRFDYQDEPGGIYTKAVGAYKGGVTSGGGPIFRWQSVATVNWALGPFGAGIVGRYKSGYVDQNAGGEGNRVASYTVFDLSGTWQPSKSFQLTMGVKNIFDRDPPYSNQAATFQVGYDPRYADPIGRDYYVRGTYTF